MTAGDDWCGEHEASASPTTPNVSFLEFVERLGMRLRKAIEREGIVDWNSLLNGGDPHTWRNFGATSIADLRNRLRLAGVPIPSHWKA